MRGSLVLVALALLAAPVTAEAKTSAKRTASASKKRPVKVSKRTTRAARALAVRDHEREHFKIRELAYGQSVGEPWSGRLQHPAALPAGEGYFIRRPYRAFGTQTTVDLIQRAIAETLDGYPDEHVLAIGDLSAESGGLITQHRSHQSGRDVDIGLYYLEQPAGYPANFVTATEDNLDCAATFKLLSSFLATADDDGGVLMIFLDFEVQGILYRWGLDNGISESRLARIFQYPHGRGSSDGLVRHVPNHDNHMHVRFKCPAADTACH